MDAEGVFRRFSPADLTSARFAPVRCIRPSRTTVAMTAPDAHSDPPEPPTLVAPVDATVVNGARVSFSWNSSREADRYRLQVAETARFNELLIDENVGEETAVTVGNHFSTDGETLFWRVVAGSYAGWGEPSTVESFVAATEEEAEQDRRRQDDSAPVTGLARAGERQVTRRVFDFAERFEEEKRRGAAYEGIAANQIMGIAAAILVVIMVAVVVLFGWYDQVVQQTRAEATSPQNYERLQQAEMEATQRLSQYGVVDEEEGIYRIPIDRAMDLVAAEDDQPSADSDQAEE